MVYVQHVIRWMLKHWDYDDDDEEDDGDGGGSQLLEIPLSFVTKTRVVLLYNLTYFWDL